MRAHILSTPTLAAGAILLLASLATAQTKGAIFTTNASGSVVNGNIYAAKTHVYLTGGPQPNAPCSAAGLDNGDYYFMVTDPAGKVLLSTDGIGARRVRVHHGVISHNFGTHVNGAGKCPGAISVQLMPYADAPGPGNEYKVWMTKVGDYNPWCGPGTKFGFSPAKSKTDNFKVRSPRCVAITGRKFYDANANGVFDQDEPPIEGWRIELAPEGRHTFTGAGGLYSFMVDTNSGPHVVTESVPPPGFFPAGTWINTTPTSGPVSIGATAEQGPDFGNVCLGSGGACGRDFWLGTEGRALLDGGLLQVLKDFPIKLYLRDQFGNDVLPTLANGAAFQAWLAAANDFNMAYSLSAELVVQKLCYLTGGVKLDLIYHPSFGFMSVGNLVGFSFTTLESDPLTLVGHPARPLQESLRDALRLANTGHIFVQPEPCSVPDEWGSGHRGCDHGGSTCFSCCPSCERRGHHAFGKLRCQVCRPGSGSSWWQWLCERWSHEHRGSWWQWFGCR